MLKLKQDSGSGRTLGSKEEIRADIEAMKRARTDEQLAEGILDGFCQIIENGRRQVALQQEGRWGQPQIKTLRAAMMDVLLPPDQAVDRGRLEWLLDEVTKKYAATQIETAKTSRVIKIDPTTPKG